MISDKILSIAGSYYIYSKTTVGLFFIYYPDNGATDSWYQCRDEFRGAWDGTRTGNMGSEKPINEISRFVGMGALMPNGLDINYLNTKWEEIETTLGLTERSVIHRIKGPEHYMPLPPDPAVIFNLLPFWIENETRRSLVTLLIRMLIAYGKPTLNESIDNYPLSKMCAPAIKWFLAGHTKSTSKLNKTGPANGYVGFVNQYTGLSQEELAKVLIKP